MASGPLQVSVRLPLTEAGVAAAANACAAAADAWLGWLAEAEPASWMANRMIYDRDCMVRQLLRGASARGLEAYGLAADDAAALAAAHAGRLDMMGHNLMQEQGGFGSDPDEGRD